MRSDFDDNPDELEGAVALRKVQRGWLERAEQAEAENEQLKQKRNEACDERDRARAERNQLQERVEQAEYTAVESAKLAAQVSAERDRAVALYEAQRGWLERAEQAEDERDRLRATLVMLCDEMNLDPVAEWHVNEALKEGQ